jgi:ABC-2 type transport system permease protein
VLATATSRVRWAASHLLIALGGSVVLAVGAGLGLGITYGIVIDDLGQVARLTGAAVAYVPALWIVAGIAFVVFGALPTRTALAWAAVGLFAVIGFLGQLLQLPNWVMDLSPFQHVPAMPAEGFSSVPLVMLTAVAAVLVGIGMAAFRHRDTGF